MKLFIFIISLIFNTSIYCQSYWFGGMTRLPSAKSDGFSTAFNIGGQNFGHNLKSVTNLSTGQITSFSDEEDTDIGFKTFQLGIEGAWQREYFDLEVGTDLGLSGMNFLLSM